MQFLKMKISAPVLAALLLAAPAALPSSVPLAPQAAFAAEAGTQGGNAQNAQAAPEETGWYWLSSNDKYSNYFDPSSIVATGSVETAHGRVATEIEAYIKTSYSYGGAQETIQNYGIQNVIPNPAQFAYSVALLKVNPQNRTVQYAKEDFYDPQGKVVWSHADDKEKEVNSQSFDEQFYTVIVDNVFHEGETERAKAKDRWLTLYTSEVDGLTTTAQADTTTMRKKGDNLLFWEWDTLKDAAGNTLEVKFLKKAVNLPQGTERVIRAQYWSGQTGWQDLEDDLGGAYRMISSSTLQAQGLTALRTYAQTHVKWVNRYSIN